MSTSQWSSSNNLTTKSNYIPNSEEAILTAADKASSDLFGNSVAIDATGTRCVIGAPYKTISSISRCGKIYVFVRNGNSWSQELAATTLIASISLLANDYFGWSVDIDSTGERIVIGHYSGQSGVVGRAIVLVRSGTSWSHEFTVQESSGIVPGDYFGHTVCFDSTATRMIVSAPWKTVSGNYTSGQCFIYKRTGSSWVREYTLTMTPLSGNARFGLAIDIDNDATRCIISAQDIKKAYIFIRSGTTWSQEAIIDVFDGTSSELGAKSVSMDSTGTRVAISTPNAEYIRSQAGKVKIFLRTGTSWSLETTLSPTDIQGSDYFGWSTSMNSDGNILAISSVNADPDAISNAGKAYIFTRSGATWSQVQTFSASDKTTGANFGQSISITADGTRTLVGAYSASPSGINSAGAAYIFS